MADERIDVRSRMFKTAGKVFLKTIFGGLLAAIVYVSMTMIFTGLGTQVIGEEVYEYDENSNPVLVETIIYDKTTTTTATTTTAGDTTVTTVGSTTTGTTGTTSSGTTVAGATTTTGAETTTTTTKPDDGRFSVAIRSDISPTANVFYQLLSTLCMVLLLLCMPYSDLWTLGDKDNNNVSFGRLSEDKWRGVKIGLLAGIPSFICYLLLVLSKVGLLSKGFLGIYRLLNIPYILVINFITGGAMDTAAMPGWCLIPLGLLTLLVPAVCGLGYYWGYREFSLSERFIYTSGKKKHHRR